MNWKKFVVLILVLAMCLSLMAFSEIDVNAEPDTIENGLPQNGNVLISTETILEVQENPEVLKVEAAVLEDENQAMANFLEDQDVYESPDSSSPVVGKIFNNTLVNILSKSGDWAQISTGNLIGYVPCSCLMFGDEGKVLMNAKCDKLAEILTDTQVFEAADPASAPIMDVYAGESYSIVTNSEDGWVQIDTGDGNGYVGSEFVAVTANLQAGLTNEELSARDQEMKTILQKIASGKASASETAKYKKFVMGTCAAYRNIQMTDEERRLLERVVYYEAGDDYNEALAVVNVIYNRYISGEYGNTITDVLTAKNQFSTINKALSTMDQASPDLVGQAIDAASAGQNNIGAASGFYGSGIHNNYYGNVEGVVIEQGTTPSTDGGAEKPAE